MSFLFVDRIIKMDPGKSIQGIKQVTWDDTYLMPDESGAAVFAPSFIGETLGQLAAWNVMAFYDFKFRPVAGIVASTRLNRQARPGDTILLESIIDDLDEAAVCYHSTASINQDIAFTIEGAIGPLLPMEQFIDEATVRQQFAEIYRPYDDILQQYITHSVPAHSLLLGAPPQVTSHRALCFDQCQVIEPGQHWCAHKLITRAASYFPDHFPKNPVLPMTVLLQCKINLARQFIASINLPSTYVVHELRKIKMNEFVHPGDEIVTHLKLKSQTDDELILNYRSEVAERRVCVVDIVLKRSLG